MQYIRDFMVYVAMLLSFLVTSNKLDFKNFFWGAIAGIFIVYINYKFKIRKKFIDLLREN